MIKATFTCLNRQCRADVSQPGKCGICTAMWKKTVETANAAYGPKNEEALDAVIDDLDDEYEYNDGSFFDDDQEDFGADMGISISDPIDRYYD